MLATQPGFELIGEAAYQELARHCEAHLAAQRRGHADRHPATEAAGRTMLPLIPAAKGRA